MRHGRSAANPRGCDGAGQAPYRPTTGSRAREREQEREGEQGAIVIGFTPTEPDPPRVTSSRPLPPEVS